MNSSSLLLGLVIALELSASVFAQNRPPPIAVEKGVPTTAKLPVARNPELIVASQRLQSSFGIGIKLGLGNDPAVAKIYDITPIETEHVANALSMLEWINAELKRYPEGFLRKFGSKNLVLANAYISKASKRALTPYSPTFIAHKNSSSIFVTVPTTMTATTEALGRGSIHSTLFSYLLEDVKAPESPIGLSHWKTLESDDSAQETESAKRLTKASNSREGLYKIMWDPSDFAELNTLAKTDARLKQRIEVVQDFLRTLDPQFNQAYWTALGTIPEHQRIVCLNDLADTHSNDQIKADATIQNDIRTLEKQWGFKVLWEPGSAAPPMPSKVRLEYSYFTDKKLPQLKEFIHMIRDELQMYPAEITQRLNIKNLFILDDFNFRGAGVAGQGMSWLPQVSFAYGLHGFDTTKTTSMDFLRRTIHHEVLHLMDKEFSKEGGPMYGEAWESLNETGFVYKISRINAVVSNTPTTPTAPTQAAFYKDNTKWQGFAEPYGMNIATDDRATLYGRLMTARLADGGKGDQPFLERLETDRFLKAKAARMNEFFQLLKRDFSISPSSPLYARFQSAFPPGNTH
jgi:hypothetical protein